MMYLRWLFITFYALATTLLAVILTPIVVLLFADHRTGRLAWPFRWMETPDVLLPGDPNHVGSPSTEYDLSGWYWTSMRWLWRNPAYRATDWAKFVPPAIAGQACAWAGSSSRGSAASATCRPTWTACM